jgi:hypothetical protein
MPEEGSSSKFARGADDEIERRIKAGALPEEQFVETSWQMVDLEPYKRGEQVVAPPQFLVRSDGRALIYPGRPHVFFGESESLKSWAALEACREVIAAGYTALYVDFESSEPSFVERCRHARVPEAAIGAALQYVRPTEPLTGAGSRALIARSEWNTALSRTNGLVVLDGVSECYALHSWNINDATDAARSQATFSVAGAATIAIDHTAKDAGRGVLGSQHKRAGLDGAEYEFTSRVRGGRGGESISAVRVTKDRHGWVREWTPPTGAVGLLKVDPRGVRLEAPGFKDLIDPRDDRVDRVVEYVVEHPRCSTEVVRRGLGISKLDARDALASAETAGRVRDVNQSDKRHTWEPVK